MIKNAKSGGKKSPVTIIEVIVIAVLLVFIVAMIIVCFTFKNKGGTPKVFGTYLYNTKAVNMLPDIPENTLIFAKDKEIPNIKPGSVILCKIDTNTVLIRVRETLEEDGKQFYIVRFDTSPVNETFKISKDDVVAVALKQDSNMGKIIAFATTTSGILLIIIIPCFLIILFQVIRIVNIKRLEEQASSIDDIDEIIFSRNQEEEMPLKLTKPVFHEDVTTKIPVLSVDSRGKADYSLHTANSSKNPDPLFTSEKYTNRAGNQRENVNVKSVSFERPNNNDQAGFYLNKPTKIADNQPKSKVDDFFETYKNGNFTPNQNANKAAEKPEKVSAVFTPFISNVIPDNIANVQEKVAETKTASFDDSVKAFYTKEEASSGQLDISHLKSVDTIPEKAVIPKETIAPPKRKKNSKTLDELMSIIDKEENKLKK